MPVDGFNRRSQNANAFSYNQFSRNNAGDRSQLNNSGANNIFIQQGKTKYNNTANQQRSNQQSISRGSGGGNKYRFGGSNQPGSSNAATLTQPQRGLKCFTYSVVRLFCVKFVQDIKSTFCFSNGDFFFFFVFVVVFNDFSVIILL